MRIAAIDLGSNTVRLLVADVHRHGGWQTVEQAQQVTRLGEGLAPGGALGALPMERTARAVAEYVRRGRTLGAAVSQIVATSAVREAANGRAFGAELERATGVAVRIVSGHDEARLTLRGVLAGLPPRESAIVFDIGGGSTEFILAEGGRLRVATSLPLGVVPLAERHPFPGAVYPARYGALAMEVRARLAAELPSDITRAATDELIGTAGTVTTLAALDLDLATYDADRVQGHVLDQAAVERQLARLAALDVAERAALPCLEPGRADLIVPGIAIVLEAMACLGHTRLTVSDRGLREGILAELAEGGRRV